MLVLCSPLLQEGDTYTVYVGGSSSGTVVDSLYFGGGYAGGDEYATVTLSGAVTLLGTAGGMGLGGGGGGVFPGR